MLDVHALELVAGLSRDVRGRRAAARELAQYLGAGDLLLLIPDRVHAIHIPAFGFPQTLFGGRLWREFISPVIKESFAIAELSYPTQNERRTARGWVCEGNVVRVLFDGQPGGRKLPRRRRIRRESSQRRLIPFAASCRRLSSCARKI